MKNTLIIIIVLLGFASAKSSTLETVVSLKGEWKFSIGDNPDWAKADFDDSSWDKLYVPETWEEQGYVGYDGYAWYRKKVNIPTTDYNDALFIDMGHIDDVNEVYLNGVKIGQLGVLPPEYKSAFNNQLLYYIPKSLIRFNGENTLAVRVYDQKGVGGIVSGKVGIYYDKNNRLIDYDLSGKWKLSFVNYPNCRDINYNDSKWYTVNVPGSWESQGYNDYNGHAWYRKSFIMPEKLSDEKLYLILGKIDDRDRVFLNGKEIASYKDMYNTSFECKWKGDWQMRRAYKISAGMLKVGEKNTIAVLVFDRGGIGGIHEGPIGLMTKDNYNRYASENEEHKYYDNYSNIFDLIFNN